VDLFEIAGAEHPLYWKTWVLDEFDGVGWARGDRVSDVLLTDDQQIRLEGAAPRIVGRRQEWVETVGVSVLALRSTVLVTTGMTLGFDGVGGAPSDPDGTTPLLESALDEGDTYEVAAYAPDPSTRLLRRADGGRYPPGLVQYTTLQLPGARLAEMPLRGTASARPGRRAADVAAATVAASPYARVGALARRVTRDAAGNYEAVTAIQRYLLDNYEYRQDVPEHDYPLTAFLFGDRAGYCQHFSGAMALMLRLVGIPSRVVSGFAPGTPAGEEGAYVIRDSDAHSWVEVWFPRVGWVTVDPTPPAAPAATETVITALPDRVANDAGAAPAFSLDQRRAAGRSTTAADRRGGDDGGSPVAAVLAITLVALGAGSGVAYARRRRRLLSEGGLEDQLRELERAMPLLGHSLSPGTTLLGIERRLRATVGPKAAGYPAALRQTRYRAGWKRRPGPLERRELRRALARGRGPHGRWRALRAIPPGGPSRR
jgi:transglutaminase-like putative cysteine protease